MLAFLAIFWMSFLVGFSGALVPGPVLSVTIKEAAARGARAGPLVVLGHGIAEVAITVALVLGVSTVLHDVRVKACVASAGGVFLVVMGCSMLLQIRSSKKIETSSVDSERGASKTPVLLGLTTTVSNPYWFGWWGSVGASLLVASSSLGRRGLLAFVSGHVLSDLVWYTLVAYFVSIGLSYSRGLWYRIAFAVCGSFLVAVGGLFVRYGINMAGKI